jgi:hypothetical protein
MWLRTSRGSTLPIDCSGPSPASRLGNEVRTERHETSSDTLIFETSFETPLQVTCVVIIMVNVRVPKTTIFETGEESPALRSCTPYYRSSVVSQVARDCTPGYSAGCRSTTSSGRSLIQRIVWWSARQPVLRLRCPMKCAVARQGAAERAGDEKEVCISYPPLTLHPL